MTDTATLGLYGLGTMGSALALNILDRGFPLHVANRTEAVTTAFADEARTAGLADRLTTAPDLAALARSMPAPRAILLMVPAGKPVDATIARLLPELAPGDTIIDGGNADFHDTRRRASEVEAKGFTYIGMGVSGGEAGARSGPSMMLGGTAQAWDAIRPVIEAIAARHAGDPCADHLGPDGAGHFVKTVHNGIEYADMQIIAEIYGLLRGGMDRSPDEIGALFSLWNDGPLRSYLTEITADLLPQKDAKTGGWAVDAIVDAAGQKGTGRWTVIEAVRLGQSATAIEGAVAARAWSSDRAARAAGADILGTRSGAVDLDDDTLEQALLAARILAHGQGFRILQAASEEYDWDLDLARIAEIWRAGCIIRSALLDDIAGAARGTLPEGELILAPALAAPLRAALPALRRVTAAAIAAAHPVPALSGALAFADTMSQPRGTANLIQAQRDVFGYHGFTHVDGTTDAHGPWWD